MRWLVLISMLASPAAAQRVELPVRQVTLSDGVRRYAVTLTINGQPVEAGIDTGSTGLRVIGPKLPGGAGLKGPAAHYGYGAGIEFAGPAVTVSLAPGALASRDVRVQRVDRIDCKAGENCAANHLTLDQYGIQGDGIAGQGFPAILGIGMREDAVANPFVQAGVTRWIIDIPRSEGEPGRLVLNPGDDEVARYKQIRFLQGRNQVAGCIVSASAKLCAPAMVDSGATGLRVQGGRPSDVLADGTQAQLVIGDQKASAAMQIAIGRRDQATGMGVAPAREPGRVSLSFGIAPYLRWSVLYDARAKTIGVADRP